VDEADRRAMRAEMAVVLDLIEAAAGTTKPTGGPLEPPREFDDAMASLLIVADTSEAMRRTLYTLAGVAAWHAHLSARGYGLSLEQMLHKARLELMKAAGDGPPTTSKENEDHGRTQH
jgi:hypothetical protein